MQTVLFMSPASSVTLAPIVALRGPVGAVNFWAKGWSKQRRLRETTGILNWWLIDGYYIFGGSCNVAYDCVSSVYIWISRYDLGRTAQVVLSHGPTRVDALLPVGAPLRVVHILIDSDVSYVSYVLNYIAWYIQYSDEYYSMCQRLEFLKTYLIWYVDGIAQALYTFPHFTAPFPAQGPKDQHLNIPEPINSQAKDIHRHSARYHSCPWWTWRSVVLDAAMVLSSGYLLGCLICVLREAVANYPPVSLLWTAFSGNFLVVSFLLDIFRLFEPFQHTKHTTIQAFSS